MSRMANSMTFVCGNPVSLARAFRIRIASAENRNAVAFLVVVIPNFPSIYCTASCNTSASMREKIFGLLLIFVLHFAVQQSNCTARCNTLDANIGGCPIRIGENGRSAWSVQEVDEQAVTALVRALDVSRAAAAVFVGRGLDTVERIDGFARLDMGALHDPHRLPDMGVAVTRLNQAIDQGENIRVYSDSDVDGLCACATLVYILRRLGASVSDQIAGRYSQGFGVKPGAVKAAKAAGASLIIAVDSGMSTEAAECARSMGMDFMVIDHHEMPDARHLPPAHAVINPKRTDSAYPFSGLTSAALAMKVMVALTVHRGHDAERVMAHLLDLTALGTVCDQASMTGENRVLAHLGCAMLAEPRRIGIRQLFRLAGIIQPVDTITISHSVGPRLNAAARLLGPTAALEWLLTSDEGRALRIAERLEEVNRWRQARQQAMFEEALSLLPEIEAKAVVPVIQVKSWHVGVASLAARQLMERLDKKAVVLATIPDGDNIVTGICRGNGILDVLAALQGCGEHLTRLGGKERVAFFNLEAKSLLYVTAHLNTLARTAPPPTLRADARVRREEISFDTMDAVSAILPPYGNENPEPLYLGEGLTILGTRTFGVGRHLELHLEGSSPNQPFVRAVAWNRSHEANRFAPGVALDIVFRLRPNHYCGRRYLQLVVEALREAKTRPMRHQLDIALIRGSWSRSEPPKPASNGHNRTYEEKSAASMTGRTILMLTARRLRLTRKGVASPALRPRFHRTDLRKQTVSAGVVTTA